MIAVLSDDQLERIEDALESAREALIEAPDRDAALVLEVADALLLVRATRPAMTV